jgi:O-antigen/teichoic acid export membrane protein
MFGNLYRALNICIGAIALWMKWSPVAYAFTLFAISVSCSALVILDLWRLVPPLHDVEISWRMAKRGREFLHGSLTFWLISVSQTLNLQGVTIVLSLALSGDAIALFSTHRTVVGLIAAAASVLQPAIWAELSLLVSAPHPQHQRVASLTLVSIKAAVISAGGLALALWVLVPHVYGTWTRHRFELNPALIGVLAVQAVLMAGWSTTVWPLLAANRLSQVAAWSVANAIATIIGTSFAVFLGWGLVAAALASTLADLLCGFVVFPAIAARFLSIPTHQLYAAMGRGVGALVPLILASLVFDRLTSQGWLQIVSFVIVAIAFFLPTAWLGLGSRGLKQLVAGFRAMARGTFADSI